MHSCHLTLLVSLALPGVPYPAPPDGPSATQTADEQALKVANLPVTGPGLVEFFKKRTPSAANNAAVAPLVKQLADKDAANHPKASADLIALGPAAVKQLRALANSLDNPDAAARALRCLQRIEGSGGSALVAAAARLLGALRAEGAAEALIDYYPYADDEATAREVEGALAQVAVRDGKPDAAVVKALQDDTAPRRAAAAVALCRAGGISVHERVRPLLKDPKPTVRFQAALALASAHDAEAVPILIDLLAELPSANRKETEDWLGELAGDWGLKVPQGNDATARRLRRELWLAWWNSLDGKQLAEEFRSRTLSDDDREKVLALIKKLDGDSADEREQASQALVTLGPRAVPLLRRATQQGNARVTTMAQKCVELIEKEAPNPLPQPAARLLALRRPDGALATLLAYLPFADSDASAAEIRDLIGDLGVRDGKPDALLLKALEDRAPARRAAAACALSRVNSPEYLTAVRRLLQDSDLDVRFTTALALAAARHRDAVPALIALLGDLPPEQGWEVEDYLSRLAGEKAPGVPLTADPAGRAKVRDAWAAWWKEEGHTVDLAKVDPAQRQLGLTLLVEPHDPTKGLGRVLELDAGGKVRWKIEGLAYPTDAQVVGPQRVLIAEQNAGKVVERDFSGKILWQKEGLSSPFVAQRLRNGNTFIGCRNGLMEVDRQGKQVYLHSRPNEYFLAATKFRDGTMAYVNNNGQYARLDAAGKEVKAYRVAFNPNWGFNVAEILPNDNVIISVQAMNKLTEVTPEGKTVWEATVQHAARALTRLPNGHTLAPHTNTMRMTELDRSGKVVNEWKDLGAAPVAGDAAVTIRWTSYP